MLEHHGSTVQGVPRLLPFDSWNILQPGAGEQYGQSIWEKYVLHNIDAQWLVELRQTTASALNRIQ